MRWLGLLLVVGCTLLTDPDGFESTVDAGSRPDTATDTRVDTAADAPTDIAIDTSNDCCIGDSCITTATGTFSRPAQVFSLEAGGSAIPNPFRKVRLVRSDSGIVLIRPTDAPTRDYEVHPIAGGGVQPILQWLRNQGLATSCAPDEPVLDIDVRRFEGSLAGTLIHPEMPGFQITHIASGCNMHNGRGVAEGFASAGVNAAYSRAKPAIALPTDPPTLVYRNADEFTYVEVLGIDALGPLAIVSAVTDAGASVQYWVDGDPRDAISTATLTAAPRLAAAGPMDFVAAYAVGGQLEIDRVNLDREPLSQLVALGEPPSIGSELAVGMVEPEGSEAGVIVVAATNRSALRAMTLYAIDLGRGTTFELDTRTVDSNIRGLDLVVDPTGAVPVITFAIATDGAEAWQLRFCPTP